MKQLKPQDAQFLYMETENNLSNASTLCLYKTPQGAGDVDPFTTVKERIAQRLDASLLLTHKIQQLPGELDYPYWKRDSHFNLEQHLFIHQLAPPANREALFALFADIHSQPLNMRRPPWEIHVISGLDKLPEYGNNSFALVIKLHHSAIDGTSAMKLLQAFHDDAPAGSGSDGEHQLPEPRTLLRQAGRNLLASPFQSATGIYRQWQQFSSSGKAASKQSPIPQGLFNAPVGPEKSFIGCQLPLRQIKAIKSLVEGATVNDALLAICGGGLHRYLSAKQRLPNIPLVAWVPINARTDSTAEQDGNNITATAIRIGTQLSAPLERLAVIRQHTLDAKLARTGRSARMMTELTQHLPNPVMAPITKLLMATGAASKLCNLAISNVPGPQQALHLSSAECLEYYGMVPLSDEMGLFIVAMSYNGMISLGVTSTPEILPDPQYFVDCLLEEYHAYLASLGDQQDHAAK